MKVHIRTGELGVTEVSRHPEHMLIDLIMTEGTRLQRGHGPGVPQVV